MARFYSNENIPLPAVSELRRLGHDVLTSMDAGNANASVPDSEVLAFAAREGRICCRIIAGISCVCISHGPRITRESWFAPSIRNFLNWRSEFTRRWQPPVT
ncbi:MAG TPA: DUF5615 family PIN-like protein [Bryobacteraceae bacterium]|nr:DUF5615 family PIN-like protein [Bryobacteraceae bacterium]